MDLKPILIFDIDDTLIDHSGAENDASLWFGREYQNEIPGYTPETFVQFWHDTAERHMAVFLKGVISFQEQRRRRVKDIFRNEALDDEKADTIFNEYLSMYEQSWHLFDDVLEFFTMQHDVDFAVLSDGAQKQQELKLIKNGIHHYFDFIMTAESERLSKPDPEFFKRACERAERPASHVYYVGDNVEKDAIGASKAGLKGIWLNRNGIKNNHNVEMICTLTKLNEFI